MYKKSRIKIIGFIMSVLIILWIATLFIIFYTTLKKVELENREMMELYAEAYAENGTPQEFGRIMKDKDNKVEKDFEKDLDDDMEISDRRLQIAIFYSVAFKEEEIEVTNDGPFLFSDEELVQLAEQIKDGGKEFGILDNMVYLISKAPTYTLVVIMDNTMVGDTMDLLINYMLLFGGFAGLLLLGVSILLSSWIIQPLEENDRKQKQFVSDAGHELKTPISTVNANLEILEREIGENRWLHNIKYENKRMETIVKQLLDLAKIQSVKTELVTIDLSRIAMAGILAFEAQAFEKGIVLDYDIADKIQIRGNMQQMQMLISILVDNACSHTVKGNSIKIVLNKQHSKVQFVVSNQGDEIPLDDRERIFDRFYRADMVRNGEENHYGLGLAIAKNIVQTHQGTIFVTCKNGWTSFHVEI
jgi:two-component system, OmpR family, sensor histidine kinase CiaH